MKRFALTASMLYLALLGVTAVLERDELAAAPPAEWLMLTLEMWLVPASAVWLTAELVNAVSPRRVFDRRIGANRSAVTAGMIASVLGIALGVLMVSIPQDAATDTLLMAGASFCSTLIVVLLLRRVVRGTCVHCGYDLRGNAGLSVCPECGHGVMR